jgi:serine/threonine-protein kinase RsbW
MRHDAAEFLAASDVSPRSIEDMMLAVSEAVGNAVEHGYAGGDGEIEMRLRIETSTVTIEVVDRGTFVERERLPDRGFGLGIIRAVTQSTEVSCDGGTRVRMVFDLVH